MDPRQFNSYQEKATGRVPIARDPATLTPSLSLPATRPVRFNGDSTSDLPESPLKSGAVVDVEDVVAGLSAIPLLRGLRGFAEVGLFAKNYLIYGRSHKEAFFFYGAYFTSPQVEGLFHDVQNAILETHVPTSTSAAPGGTLQRVLSGAASQDELDRLFLQGQVFGDDPQRKAAIVAAEEQRRRDNYLKGFGISSFGAGTYEERLKAFEEGAAVRYLVDAKSLVVAQRTIQIIDALGKVRVLFGSTDLQSPETPAGSADP